MKRDGPMEPWDIVNDYFCSVCDMPEEELDADSLSLVQVWHSFGLIQNGGFHSYLCAVGERASAVADAYRQAGIGRGDELILSALALWRTYWPEPDPEHSDPDEFRNKFGSQLDDIECEFYDLEDDILGRLTGIVRKKDETRG
jgi:hypothetical protein